MPFWLLVSVTALVTFCAIVVWANERRLAGEIRRMGRTDAPHPAPGDPVADLLRAVAAEGQRRANMRTVKLDAPTTPASSPTSQVPATAPGTVVETRRPARAPSVESDVAVPALQASVTALAAAIGIAGICWICQIDNAVRVGAVGGAVVLLLGWLWRMGVASQGLFELERVLGRDLTGDGVIGRSDHLIALNPYQGRSAQESDQADELRQMFEKFVEGCENDTSVRRWRSLGPRYQEWRDLLIGSGWARWRGSDQRSGWELTATANAILAAISSSKDTDGK